MAHGKSKLAKPRITLTQTDHKRLTLLAEENADRMASVTDALFVELDRARVVPDRKIAENTIRMGSGVCFSSDLEETRQISLVFPGQADIDKGRISILTPIGVALIGLSAGQSMDWITRDGRTQHLTVEAVDPPTETAS
ncbi:nucleoside diphosphate kinase regulator [Cohaesibacter haloalkalitolerans]|uniref:nucleoside diphosphate kinase regulator n=1 Tax=Cohaesibacter haloalkalitolerans TaxID=1162980 RepID=UPI000E649C05|nr:nucleoside diphosphate kinase regulator [Cohaesibacter haloalkalitolerans]